MSLVDPRRGDIEDDASSTKQRSLIALAGGLLAEISLPKLALVWTLSVLVPALLLGASVPSSVLVTPVPTLVPESAKLLPFPESSYPTSSTSRR